MLLLLPGSDDIARRKWLSEFSDQSKDTLVDSTNMHVGVTLMCLAKDADSAKAIEEELTEYFDGGPGRYLTPPVLATPVGQRTRAASKGAADLRETQHFQTYADPPLRACC